MKGFLRLRGDTYYYRSRVPVDLLGVFFHGREILKSLHTKDKGLAKDAAAEWYCRTSRMFHLCRVKSLPESKLQELIQSELFPPKKRHLHQAAPLLRDLFDSYIREHKVNWREKSYDDVVYRSRRSALLTQSREQARFVTATAAP